MIAKTKAYTDTQGQLHPNIESAQKAELRILLNTLDITQTGFCVGTIVDALFTEADKVRDILSTRATSRPAARKVNKPKPADAKAVKKGLDAARKAADAPAA